MGTVLKNSYWIPAWGWKSLRTKLPLSHNFKSAWASARGHEVAEGERNKWKEKRRRKSSCSHTEMRGNKGSVKERWWKQDETEGTWCCEFQGWITGALQADKEFGAQLPVWIKELGCPCLASGWLLIKGRIRCAMWRPCLRICSAASTDYHTAICSVCWWAERKEKEKNNNATMARRSCESHIWGQSTLFRRQRQQSLNH